MKSNQINHQSIVRFLIVSNLTLFLIYGVMYSGDYFKLDGILGEAQASLASLDSEEMNPLEWVFGAFIIPFFASLIGLWRSSSWGRYLYTVSTVALTVLAIEPDVSHPVESLLDSIDGMLTGALLAVIWLPRKGGTEVVKGAEMHPE